MWEQLRGSRGMQRLSVLRVRVGEEKWVLK